MANVADTVWQLAKPVAEGLGLTLWDVVYVKEGARRVLRITIDKQTGVTIDDCEAMHRAMDPILDEADPIESAYTLDISSLGAEKPIALEKLGEYVGRYVNLHLSNPYQGENILEGTIESIDEEILVLKLVIKGKAKNVELKRSNIDKARLAIQF